MNEKLKEKLAQMPKSPGVYLWKNNRGEIIYVGKAKNLFNRTHSYFNSVKNAKTTRLVQNIFDVEIRMTPTVNDALILENNLIKKYLPKYNILLKDDSYYPYIVVTDEKNPRILYTNTYNKIKGTYYGPFADSEFKIYDIYRLLETIIPFRKCKKLPNKSCIYYDIGQCLAPCIKKINTQTYDYYKKMIANIFNKDIKNILDDLNKKEMQSASNLQFEMADTYKKTADGLIRLINNKVVELSSDETIDIVGYFQEENYLSIIICGYVNGKWLEFFNEIFEIYSSINEVITGFLFQYYQSNKIPKKIVVNLDDESLSILTNHFHKTFEQPQTNKIKEVLNNIITNAKTYLKNNLLSSKAKNERTINALEQLQKITQAISVNRIEIFDNSNLYGQTPVGGVNVYLNGIRNKKMSRHYNLPEELDGDYHYMYEVMLRRYSNILNRNEQLPNMIIVDGGIIQINACLKALRQLKIDHMIDVIGLKKNMKHQTEAIVLSNGTEILLDKKSGLYYFLANMQEDIHNFIISYFRKRYLGNSIKSFTDEIQGLGPKRKALLFKNYPTIESIKKASYQELCQILPQKIVDQIKEKLNDKD